jgi:hypothetical protein
MNYTLRRIPQFFLKMHRKERFMGVHSVQGAHPHTAAPLVVTALPRVITHGREKTKENAYYMRIYRKQAHKKRHWVLY